MRKEPRWQDAITADLEVMGVYAFIDTAWTMRIRIRTTPSQRWAVNREFNRRVKYCFDENAVQSPITAYKVQGWLPPGAERPMPQPEPTPAPRPPGCRPSDQPSHHPPDHRRPGRPDGFAFVHDNEMRGVLEANGLADWDGFAASWDDLGLDTYMADGGRYRRRRHAVFAASAAGIARLEHRPHYQSRDYNALNGGVARWFDPVTARSTPCPPSPPSCAPASACSTR